MVYCTKCGNENESNASFCQNCGTRIKPKKNKSNISKLINWKPIIIGIIAYFVFMVLITAIIDISGVNFLIPTSGGGISSSYLMVYFFMMTSTGIIIGFFSGKEYLNGIINSVIVAIFYSIFIGLYSGLFHFIEALVFLGVFGLIGSLIGVIIYRRYNNYNLIG